MVSTRLLAVVSLISLLVEISKTCSDREDHGIEISGDREETDPPLVEERCTETLTEESTALKFKTNLKGKVVRIKDDVPKDWVMLDPASYPSSSNRWRISSCENQEMAMLMWADINGDDYVQMNKRVFKGSTCANSHPVLFPFESSKTVLVGLVNQSRNSTLRIGVICPSKEVVGIKGLTKTLLECKQVRDYIGTYEDRFLALKDILTTGNLFKLLNTRDSRKHVCMILHISSQSCGVHYLGGACSDPNSNTQR